MYWVDHFIEQRFWKGLLFIVAIVFQKADCSGQTNSEAYLFIHREKPPAYKAALERFMATEVDAYAARLNLDEALPISTNSITEWYVTSPTVAMRFGALGTVHTANFSYSFSKGGHLCYITRIVRGDNPYEYTLNKKYAINPLAVNTNAAFVGATQYLARAFVDFGRLSTSSVVSVQPVKILDMTTSKYTVQWSRNARPVVKVVVAEPQDELWVLRVEDSTLILRPPLNVKNLYDLLSATNRINSQDGNPEWHFDDPK